MRLKRTFDVLVAGVGLICLAPLLCVIGMLVCCTSAGPAIYCGSRVGRGRKPFRMLKFRTMIPDAEKLGGACTASTDTRITQCGAILRAAKLDELPQLWNVLVGDMSLVGPRPEVAEWVERFRESDEIILSVRPGITDWASIWNIDEGSVLAGCPDPDQAYSELILPTKRKLQRLYVENWSIGGDLKILAATIAGIAGLGWRPAEVAHLSAPGSANSVSRQTHRAS